MALLSDQNRWDVWADVMRDLSNSRTPTPLTKTELRALVNYIDGHMETSESAMFSGLPAGDGKDWLLANPQLGRELITRVEQKRREVL